ncbi:hypothetical protein CBFG_03278 [Clostridiales bacterium 1_7_47FAA]|nr:hypothetical protein CBFG_03278 [Clostridiales bacterium 1_7_47FAA]
MSWLIIIILLLLFIAFALYCCACNTTPYDREADDEQQMEYLRQYKEKHGEPRDRKDGKRVSP